MEASIWATEKGNSFPIVRTYPIYIGRLFDNGHPNEISDGSLHFYHSTHEIPILKRHSVFFPFIIYVPENRMRRGPGRTNIRSSESVARYGSRGASGGSRGQSVSTLKYDTP